MSRWLIGSITSFTPACRACPAAQSRLAAYTLAAVTGETSAGTMPAMQCTRPHPSAAA